MQEAVADEGNDKESRFKSALQGFCGLAARDSQTAQDFAEAYWALRTAKLKGISMTSAYNQAGAIFKVNGRTPLPSLLYYLGDAVELYELRRDEYQGQTALLFEPSCSHIKELRHIIHLLQDSELAEKGNKGYIAAIHIEAALNTVQESFYLPKTALRDGAQLSVKGYGGVVSREYNLGKREGPWDYKGLAVIEMESGEVVPNLGEINTLLEYLRDNRSPVDIVAITDDGGAYRFNFLNRADDHYYIATVSAHLAKEPSMVDFLKEMDKYRAVGRTLPPDALERCEKQFLPYLVRTRPPLVDVTVKRAI